MSVLPGSTIGILGGGQLGRMLALAARRLGYYVVTLDPTPNSPCGQVADEQIMAKFEDVTAALLLAEKTDVITYEFENIPAEVVAAIEARGKPIFPSSEFLKVSQNRVSEKEFFKRIGVPVVDYHAVSSEKDLEDAAVRIGFPAVLKTASGGYDGKGQAIVDNLDQARAVFKEMQGTQLVWEKKIPFLKEISVICARNSGGEIVSYPVSENVHVHNILHTAVVPAKIPVESAKAARDIAERVAVSMKVVGVFCVEMFLMDDGSVYANEIAPRPHNSGHYSIDACVCSQFEQQLRAICGLPLGSTKMVFPAAAMANILGEGKGNTLSGVEEVLKNPDLRLHLYGKSEARAKRKMGHLTSLANDADAALSLVVAEKKKLAWV